MAGLMIAVKLIYSTQQLKAIQSSVWYELYQNRIFLLFMMNSSFLLRWLANSAFESVS